MGKRPDGRGGAGGVRAVVAVAAGSAKLKAVIGMSTFPAKRAVR
jgi:hypothetical protein